jgi:prefoldin subunit 5
MTEITVTEKINAWIEQFGSERDALNVAITRLESAQSYIKELEQDLDEMRRGWFEKNCA